MKNPFKKIKKHFKRDKAKKVKHLDVSITFNNGDDNCCRAIMQMGCPFAENEPVNKCDNMACFELLNELKQHLLGNTLCPDEQFEHEIEPESDVEVYQELEQDVEIDNEAEDEIIAAVSAENNA